MESFWASFRLDPRVPAHTHLRASDADRAVVSGLLADAYADGRLTRVEHDERESANLAAKTLGELPPLVADLVGPAGSAAPVLRSARELRAEAARLQVRRIWEAAAASSTPFVICLVIWVVSGMGDFWPVWALIPMIVSVAPMIVALPGSIRSKAEKLDRQQREALNPPATERAESTESAGPAESPAE